MRHGKLDLDLTTVEFLTDPELDPVEELARIKSGNHIIRDGNADSHYVKGGGHPGGRPLRVAVDRISGKMFARVAEHIPTDLSSEKLENQKERLEAMQPFHVPGHGYWVPLDEILPEHPHAKLFNA